MMSHSSTFLLPNPTTNNAPAVTHALVVLNRGLPRFTPLLWKHAQVRTCADHGANRLYDELPLLFPDEDALAIRKRHLGPSTRAYVALQLQHSMILTRMKILDPRVKLTVLASP